MSTPPEELPAPPKVAAPKPPPRTPKPTDDGNGSDNGPVTVASAADAPAPPRRGRREPGAAPGAVAAAAKSAASAPLAPDPPKPVRDRDATKSKSGPDTAKTGTAPDPPKSNAAPTLVPTADVKPEARAASSDGDAEAVLVDDSKPNRFRGAMRRFSRTGRATDAATVAATAAPPIVAPAPAPVAAPATVATIAPSGRTSAVRSERHYRQTVVKVDLWSVTKLSLCFYLSAMFVTVVALVALWLIADAAGIIHSVEKFLGDLLSAKNFHFLSATVLRGAILVGLVVVALQVVLTIISASFYNIFAELFGGVVITVKEEGSGD